MGEDVYDPFQRTCWLDRCGHCLWCRMQVLRLDVVAWKKEALEVLVAIRKDQTKPRRVFGTCAKEILYFDNRTGGTWKYDRVENTLRWLYRAHRQQDSSTHAQSSSTQASSNVLPLPPPPLPPLVEFFAGPPGCWVKYCDPKDGRMWWCNDKSGGWFFEETGVGSLYFDEPGRWERYFFDGHMWCWHNKSYDWFFEKTGCRCQPDSNSDADAGSPYFDELGCWVKYCDPKDGRMWWYNDKSGDWLFEKTGGC